MLKSLKSQLSEIEVRFTLNTCTMQQLNNRIMLLTLSVVNNIFISLKKSSMPDLSAISCAELLARRFLPPSAKLQMCDDQSCHVKHPIRVWFWRLLFMLRYKRR